MAISATGILSFFVALAMALSGAGYSVDVAAPSSRVTVIEDIVLCIDGTEYALNPALSFGAATEGETALFDLSMPLGEDELFEIQAKIDETGATVLLGDSANAYTFSAGLFEALMDESLVAIDMRTLGDSYKELLAASAALRSNISTDNTVVLDYFEKLLKRGDPENATFTLGDQEFSGKRYSLSLGHSDVCAVIDDIIDMTIGSEYIAAYIDYINSAAAMSGVEPFEYTGFADLCAVANIELGLDFDMTGTKYTAVGEIGIHLTNTLNDESFFIPVSIALYDQDTMEISATVQEEDAEPVNFYLMQDGNVTEANISMPTTENNESFGFALNYTFGEDGSIDCTVNLVVDTPEVSLVAYGSQLTAADMTGSGAYEASLLVDGALYALSFTMTTTDEAIEDRVAAAEKVVLNTPEEVESCDGLMLSLMGMLGDVEKLMADESVAALVELFNTYAYVESYDETDTESIDGFEDYSYEDEYEVEYEDEYWSEGDDDPADLSFDLPDFSALEGYELTGQYIYADASDCAYLYFDPIEDTGSYSTLSIDFTGLNYETTEYMISSDGVVSPAESITVRVEQDEESVTISGLIPGATFSLYYYGSDLTVEDLLSFVATLV